MLNVVHRRVVVVLDLTELQEAVGVRPSLSIPISFPRTMSPFSDAGMGLGLTFRSTLAHP